jgi:adenine-specific DNA glycosylase
MLQEFLTLVQAGDIHSLLDIARKMNVSIDMVRRIASDLAEKGYLEEIHLDCSEPSPGCGNCPVKGGCQTAARQWVLTEKGRAAVTGQPR